MFATIRNAFASADLRKKIFYTIFIIVIFRIGSKIPVPFMNADVLKQMVNADGNFLGYLNALTGGAFASATIFAMSITPYINASIIINLLTVAIPALERLTKEGDVGRKKLGKITRYTTIVLGLFQATAFYFLIRSQGALIQDYTTGFTQYFVAAVIILSFTAGTALIVWLGERIDEKGIGNGISIILFAGIISSAPQAFAVLKAEFDKGGASYFMPFLIIAIFIVIIVFIVIMTNAERRIPVSYAKRVVGRKMYGGQNTHIPIKVNMSGVMPIIFASSLISIPGTIISLFNVDTSQGFGAFLATFNYQGSLYAILYFILIIAFNYFYVAIQYNPIEISNNLRKNNGAVPGIRPGKPTSDFIAKVIAKITFIGAIFLGLVAIFPIIFTRITSVNIALGGTTVLIIVGVALDTMRQLESQMMMKHHKGFLE